MLSAVKSLKFGSVLSALAIAGVMMTCVSANAQNQNDPTVKPNTLNSSVFSIQGGERLTAEALAAADKQNYELAVSKLQDARQVYNQLSTSYQELFSSFSGIDNRIADSHRQKALQAAQLRDKTTYQLAVVYRAKNQAELAVPLLVQLIKSQQPTRELGQQAYQQLYELGFVDVPFPRNPVSTPATPAPKQ